MGTTDEAMFGLIDECRSLRAENAILKERLIDELKKLKTENAELKARLDKVVELPCAVGDRLYIISKPCNGGEWFLVKESWALYVVIDIYLSIGKEPKFRITNRYGTAKLSDFGKTIFLTEAEAQARLDEMKRRKIKQNIKKENAK